MIATAYVKHFPFDTPLTDETSNTGGQRGDDSLERVMFAYPWFDRPNRDDEWRSRDLPPVLYHYTTAAGALAILQSAELWATDVRFMNDSDEMTHAIRVMLSDACDLPCRAESAAALKQILTALSDSRDGFFAACLSANGDLLSQWRGYADDGLGYAIGLRTEALLRNVRGTQRNGLLRVSYGSEQLRTTCNQILIQLTDALDVLFTGDPRERERGLQFLTVGASLQLAPMCVATKNSAFAEEKEYRAVLWGRDRLVDASRRFKASRFGLTPYLHIPLTLHEDLVEIVHGPKLHNQLAASATRDLVARSIAKTIGSLEAEKALDKIRFTHSAASYR